MKVELPEGPVSSSVARRSLRAACEGVGDAVDVDDVLLCGAELVTNALLHGSPPVVLEIEVKEDVLRVAVHDSRPGAVEQHRPMTSDTAAGRGLQIVESLATRWGVAPYEGGKAIWFEIDLKGQSGWR